MKLVLAGDSAGKPLIDIIAAHLAAVEAEPALQNEAILLS